MTNANMKCPVAKVTVIENNQRKAMIHVQIWYSNMPRREKAMLILQTSKG